MKIIKQGKTEEELKAILNETKRFECRTCGCIFDANKDEYEHSLSNQYEDIYYFCKCPNCKKNAHEVKMREIEKRPKVCYEPSCRNHMLSNRCGLSFPPGTVFDGLTGSQCPYYTRREEPAPGAFSERDKGWR